MFIILLALFVLLVWALGASAKRRRAEARLQLIAAYSAGVSDALQTTVTEPAHVEPVAPHTSFVGKRTASTPESRRQGYWSQPPCPISDEAAIRERLSALGAATPEICFTGFPEADEEHLKALAEETGFRVRTNVTKRLTVLCAGEGPGPVKLAKARRQGCLVISADQFSRLAHDGWDAAS